MLTFDVLSFFTDKGIDYRERGANIMRNHIGISCPVCEDDPSYHMNISWDGTHALCFRCNTHIKNNANRVIRLLVPDISRIDEMSIFAEYPYMGEPDVVEDKIEPEDAREQRFMSLWNSFSWGFGWKNRAYENYLRGRGFRLRHCYDFGIRFGQEDYDWRIGIPIHDTNGRIVSFTARAIGNHSLRYKNCPAHISLLPPSQLLFGLYHSTQVIGSTKPYVVITEGCFDALRFLFSDIKCVALMKKRITHEQFSLLTQTFPADTPLVLFLDADVSEREIEDLLNKLALYFKQVYQVIAPKKIKDAAEMNTEQVNSFVSSLDALCGISY
jgi:hypothetical protein